MYDKDLARQLQKVKRHTKWLQKQTRDKKKRR